MEKERLALPACDLRDYPQGLKMTVVDKEPAKNGVHYKHMNVAIIKVKCKRCGHEWTPRIQDVRRCAKCKDPNWDRERVGPVKKA
jgi:predicted Zn-ribbon and HTH transcriptional regulator